MLNIPNFAAWVLIALLIWRFLSIATSQGLFSIIGNPSLVSSVHLPRHVIVLSNNVASFLGAALEFVVLLPVLVVLGVIQAISFAFV